MVAPVPKWADYRHALGSTLKPMSAPLPEDEAERLRRLRRFGLLDTPPDPRLDRITRMAAQLLECPIALVSLADETRQWFKSRVGLDVEETPREHAFCAHAILGDEVLVVPDASQDERFADNPLVTGEPSIRFYAGAPLWVGDGTSVGTLCVIDQKPRTLDEAGRQCLSDLAAIVVDAMEHHERLRRLEEAHVELAAAHEELEALSRAIGHDMRAPLRQLGALLELFEDDHREILSPRAIEELSDLRRVRERADQVIRGMSELVRLPRGGPLAVADVDLEPVLRELAKTMEERYPGLSLGYDSPRRLIRAHPALMRQLLKHLVDNGFKHGGRNVRVEVSFGPKHVRLAVLDDGPGIPPEHVDSIFEPFMRLVPKSVPGSGVGLTVVRKIVRLHGGRVWIDADRIGGSAFLVELPIA